MNRTLTTVTILAALLLGSCSKSLPSGDSAGDGALTRLEAWQEGDDTKARYNGTTIQWDASDAISIFPSGATRSVKFSKDAGSGNSFSTAETVNLNGVYALYPYSSSASLSNGQITTVINTSQTATPGSFAPDANLAVAYSEDGRQIHFKNAVSYIKISYRTTRPGITIKSIRFQTKNGANISGRFTLTPVINNGVVTDVTVRALNGVNYVALTGDIRPNTDYYLAVAPVALSAGYRIVFVDSAGNQFTKDYTAASNKATLVRNNISATGVKNIDNYQISVTAYWRVQSADEFTGGGDKYLLVKNTPASATGYRIFDEGKTDVFISTGQPLVDKFAGGSITGLSSKLSSWKTGSSAPLFMSHYVLYCFRDAYTDDGLQIGPGASEGILNPNDAYSFTLNTSADPALGKVTSFNLCYQYSGPQSTPVTLTNCYLDPAGGGAFKLMGKITQESIDGLVDVFFLSKGSQFTAAVSPDDIHSGANRAVNSLTQVGFCTTEVTTSDERTTMNNCFMIKNYYLCNYPTPEAILVYKKGTRVMTVAEYNSLINSDL